jgi:hypothetical protein
VFECFDLLISFLGVLYLFGLDLLCIVLFNLMTGSHSNFSFSVWNTTKNCLIQGFVWMDNGRNSEDDRFEE